MKLLIESTDEIVEIDGVTARVWKGAVVDGPANGAFVLVFMHRVGSDDARAQAALESEFTPVGVRSVKRVPS